MNYTRLTDTEWEKVQREARITFEKEIGKEPNRKEVRKTISNPYTISLLEWVSLFVLLVIGFFTFVKLAIAAAPFANSMATGLSHGQFVDPFVLHAFQVIMIVLLFLLATPALLYFQLLNSQSQEIKTQKEESAKQLLRNKTFDLPLGITFNSYYFSLDYIAPRLPALLVYLIVGFLFIASYYPFTSAFEVVATYLPVLAEIAFAHLLGEIIRKRTDFSTLVALKTEELSKDRKLVLENARTDERFLETLYRKMRAELFKIERTDEKGRKVQPNKSLRDTLEPRDLEALILAEYKRLTGGQNFAKIVASSNKAKAEQVLDVKEEVLTGKRTPPNGKTLWTPEDLVRDLKIQGFTAADAVNENLLSDVYDSTHKPRKAWRNGGKDMFLKTN